MIKFLTLNSIERYALFSFFLWTSIFIISLWVNINHEKEKAYQLARSQARSSFEGVDSFRKWISRQGGIYVPIGNEINPSPFIQHLPDRDITSHTGKQLTLINTPYLLRKISESKQSFIDARISGVEPLNEKNLVDNWELKALQTFNDSNTEFCEIVDYKKKHHMRLIRPTRFEPSCGNCHKDKKYRNGEIIGGLTVSVPMDPYYENSNTAIEKVQQTHAAFWFLGLLGIGFTYNRQKKHDLKRRHHEDYLRRSSVVFNNLNDGVIITDPNIKTLAINNAFKEMTGFSLEETTENSTALLETEMFKQLKTIELIKILKYNDRWKGEVKFLNKNNALVSLKIVIKAVYSDKNILTNYIFICSDISEKKNFEKKLEHLAHHDHLTDLPNRLLLNSQLRDTLFHAERENKKTAVLFLDLDHFKKINDSLGHHTGDAILVEVTERLKCSIRKKDILTRHGGDEFILIMENIDSNNDIVVMAKKLIECINPEFNINNQSYYLGVSIGISVFPDHGNSISELIIKADLAMYKAKENGRNNFKFYTPELDSNFRDRIKIETDLHDAIKNNEFIFHYQPQVSLHNNQIVGVECLIRWQHPKLGLIYPGNFIDIAEETDLMVPIGLQVIDSACAQMSAWRKIGIDVGIMAINISGKQIVNEKLEVYVSQALKIHNLPPHTIELEITENYIMEQSEQSIDTLKKLRDSSVNISIDDFGTGYSSLNYLKKLPINKIKIDRSFINDIPSDPHDIAIIDAVIGISKSLNLKVIAEGIENKKQYDFLKKNGCDEYQGYYFSKPLPADEFELLFKNYNEIITYNTNN